jgi:hypothetical protein
VPALAVVLTDFVDRHDFAARERVDEVDLPTPEEPSSTMVLPGRR